MKVIVLLLILAILWWLYNFCGGNLRCPALDHALQSPIRWWF
jgi:hypothetical protein